MKPDEITELARALKHAEQIERWHQAAQGKYSITIANLSRFGPGFRERLAEFFRKEFELQMQKIKDYKPK